MQTRNAAGLFRLIVVPLDGSAFAERALPLAASVATAAASPLHLVRVAAPPALGTELYGAVVLNAEAVEEMRREAERSLRATADRVAAGTGLAVTPVVIDSGLPAALVDYVRGSGADLVVMTTHDRGRLEQLLLGSVAASVVRRGGAPVLLVRADEESPPGDRPPKLRRLLIPLDGSEFAAQVIPHALKIATVNHMEITLLSVVDPTLGMASQAMGEGASTSDPSRSAGQAADPAATFLERAAESLRDRALTVRTRVVSHRQAPDAIVMYAGEQGIDLIAMTTHGRSGLGRLVAGSVAEAVLRTSPAPVLMYRPVREKV
ncbi:MAG: universal stress protein [Gemmatimonadaceae bacterium]